MVWGRNVGKKRKIIEMKIEWKAAQEGQLNRKGDKDKQQK